MTDETPNEAAGTPSTKKPTTSTQVGQELLEAKSKLLWHVQNEKNWYQITSAAYAYALISGNLTNASAPSYPVR
ncbi:hypothetical protein [Arthrobacter sp. N1]|uniref:hypothetical protein n=1 Tax=Arthrobacter sp. N1 TaxID=619291 RepID=UPI003BB0F61F